MKASIRELRSRTKQIMSAVQRGETVIISNHGKDYAQIIAISENKKPMKVHEPDLAFGMWKDHAATKDVKAYLNKIREGRHAR